MSVFIFQCKARGALDRRGWLQTTPPTPQAPAATAELLLALPSPAAPQPPAPPAFLLQDSIRSVG